MSLETVKKLSNKDFSYPNTKAKHVKNILEKTGAKNRTELVGLLR